MTPVPEDGDEDDDELETLQRETKQALEAAKQAIQDADAKVAAQQQQVAQSLQQASSEMEKLVAIDKNETSQAVVAAKQAIANAYDTSAAAATPQGTDIALSSGRRLGQPQLLQVSDVSSTNSSASAEASGAVSATADQDGPSTLPSKPSAGTSAQSAAAARRTQQSKSSTPASSSSSALLDAINDSDRVQEMTAEAVKSVGNSLGRLTRALATLAAKQLEALPRFFATQAVQALELLSAATIHTCQSLVDNALDQVTSIPDRIVAEANQRAVETVNFVKSIPQQLVTQAQVKTRETVEELAGIPNKLMNAAEQKVVETAAEMAQLPRKLVNDTLHKASAMADTVDQLPTTVADSLERAVQDVTEELALVPAKIASGAERKRTEAVMELKAIPGKLTLFVEAKATEVAQQVEALPTKLGDSVKMFASNAVQEVKALPDELTEDLSKIIPRPKSTQEQLQEAEEQQKQALETVRLKLEEAKVAAARAEEAKQYTLVQKRKEEQRRQRTAVVARQAQKMVDMGMSPRVTYSLTSLLGAVVEPEDRTTSKDLSAPTSGTTYTLPTSRPTAVPPKRMASPPRGVPIISGWKQNRDGSITGRIARKAAGSDYADGEVVTTLPIGGRAVGGALVQSSSGSKYYLEDVKKALLAVQEEKRRREQEAKQRAATTGAAKREALEVERASAAAVSAKRAREKFKRRKAAQASVAAKRAALEAKRRADEAKKAKAGDQKRRSGVKKAASTQAESKRKQATEAKTKQASAKQALEGVRIATPSATFSLSSLLGGDDDQEGGDVSPYKTAAMPTGFSLPQLFGAKGADVSKEAKTSVQPKKMASPPRATPVISGWKQNRDGSISGRVTGGTGFKDDEMVTTSPILGKAIAGTLVQTASGSKYYLKDTIKGTNVAVNTRRTKQKRNTQETVKPEGAAISLFGLGLETEPQNGTSSRATEVKLRKPPGAQAKKRKEMVAQRPANANQTQRSPKADKPSPTISLFGIRDEFKLSLEKDGKPPHEKSRAVQDTKRKPAKQRRTTSASAKQVKESQKAGKSSATTSLFGLGEEPKQRNGKVVGTASSSKAPRGVPTIVQWRQQKDGGVKGIIYGSPIFDDGKKVVTSPIVSGSVTDGSVVNTGSGSRYFLTSDEKR